MARATERARPILDRLRACPPAHVVVCEFETAADAAAQLLPDRVAVISPGGSNGFHKAGMGALAGRLVTIWPDACPTWFEIRRGRVPGASWHRARSRCRTDAGQRLAAFRCDTRVAFAARLGNPSLFRTQKKIHV